MRINLKSILIFFLLNTCVAAFSQITVSDVETKKEQNLIVEKPAPYDSLKTWEYFKNPVQYKRYIGQRVYLPKSNQEFTAKKFMDGYGTLEIGDFNSEAPFLFTLNPNVIQFNTQNTLSSEMLNIEYSPGNISKEYHSTLKLNSVVTNVYKPFLYSLKVNPYSNKYSFRVSNNSNIGNKYYQIIDIVYGDRLNRIMNFKSQYTGNNDGKVLFTQTRNLGRKENVTEKSQAISLSRQNTKIAYLLKDEVTNDTVLYYRSEQNRFILVPYFVKQKELYEGNYIINKSYSFETGGINAPKGSKWLCNSVTVSSKTNKLTYVLENEKGDILTRSEIKGFVLEDVVLKEEAEKKMLAQEREEKRKKEELQRKENERRAIEKRKAMCVEKFGQEKGLLIAQGKVQIGMTKEMCEIAWGEPIMVSKSTSEYGISETWHFGFIKTLYFTDGKLKRIDE